MCAIRIYGKSYEVIKFNWEDDKFWSFNLRNAESDLNVDYCFPKRINIGTEKEPIWEYKPEPSFLEKLRNQKHKQEEIEHYA